MAPNTTVWRRGAHTAGKHLVLQYYLEMWLPIVGSRNSKILIVDGFAGPGSYEDGEDGSPVIAMRTLVNHTAPISADVVFLFIEKDKSRCKRLKCIVDQWHPRLPNNANAYVYENNFISFLGDQLNGLQKRNTNMAPAFIMIDPFGFKGSEMAMIKRILTNPTCEVFSTFMWRDMQRFVTAAECDSPLTAFFGTNEWKTAQGHQGQKQKNFLFSLYKQRLKQSGAKHVLHFDLYEARRHVYSIFFGTRHLRGCDKMKEAIWKAMPYGDYRFVGGHDEQFTLKNIVAPDTTLLRDTLIKHFGNDAWISVADIHDYVSSDNTPFFTGQVKETLRAMEDDHRLEARESTRGKRKSYPPGCKIRFSNANLFPDL